MAERWEDAETGFEVWGAPSPNVTTGLKDAAERGILASDPLVSAPVPDSWFDEPIPSGSDDHQELDWQADSLCAETDPEAFFPEKGGSTRDAKKICSSCEVRMQCLEYALANDERFGIWGGLSERERRKLRKSA